MKCRSADDVYGFNYNNWNRSPSHIIKRLVSGMFNPIGILKYNNGCSFNAFHKTKIFEKGLLPIIFS